MEINHIQTAQKNNSDDIIVIFEIIGITLEEVNYEILYTELTIPLEITQKLPDDNKYAMNQLKKIVQNGINNNLKNWDNIKGSITFSKTISLEDIS